MRRFFFHLREGGTRIEDPEGQELPSLDAAKAEAEAAVREILAERIRSGRAIDGSCVEIADEAGRILATVRFADFLKSP